jgi:Ulp1 family protease
MQLWKMALSDRIESNRIRDFWRKHKYIACVIYSTTTEDFVSGKGHYTLGIVINLNWEEDDEVPINPKWLSLHFDSLHGSTGDSTKRELNGITRFIAGPDYGDLDYVEVAIPQQSGGSNDCGLYPPHFFRIFLQNPEVCITEARVSLNIHLIHILNDY